ncbi:GIY-YIG nuclease family protein [Mycobacterium sp. NPDC050853]|uniref:GIY-YIG nuclease family protein n=1 Tax=Mycobacterium sp. NPDC050853 TaxID=3155160 RepID=UPI0033F7CF7E
MKALAVLAAVAVPLSMVQPSAALPVVSAAEQFGLGAAKAFGASELGPELAGGAVLPSAQRAAGIPMDTAAGWDLPTADGRTVQLVPPGGLASGQVTAAGQVVYPDAGAGYDVLAENTAIGSRMVTRISGPEKTRTVTMFVRTPADTVMLAHTNGFLSVNNASPQAETLLLFAPSEVRDSRGALVASAYITQQLQPNLYLLSQVISPDETTAWPVYADPFGIDIPNPITAAKNAVSAVANAGEQLVNKAVEVAAPAVKTFAAANAQLASQAWSGIKTGANYVKENPLEFAQIVGGTALVATGVGTGFGAGLITSGVSGLVNKAAEANPDNKWLQAAGMVTEAATYIGPGGITGRGLKEAASLAKEGVEKLAPKLTAKADDAAKAVVPTPKPQLADEVAATGKTPTVNPVETPKAPNAPPTALELPKAPKPAPGEPKGGVYVVTNPKGQQVYSGKGKDAEVRINQHLRETRPDKQKIKPGDTVEVRYRSNDPDVRSGLEQQTIRDGGSLNRDPKANPDHPGRNRINGVAPGSARDKKTQAAADKWRQDNGQPRVASPAQQRGTQATHAQSVTNGQRSRAVDGAHQNGNSAAGNKPSSSTGSTTHHDGSGGGSPSKSSGSKNNKGNGKGKGNRAKRSRTHGH